MDNTTIEVYFTISGIFDPDEATGILGIKPSKRWKIGEICQSGRGKTTNRKSGWYITTGEVQEYDLDIPIMNILDIVYPLRDKINSIYDSNNVNIYITCYVRVDKVPPSIVLSRKLLKQAVELNAYIDISMNLISEYDDPED